MQSETPSSRKVGLADELANGLATALTNSPHIQTTPLPTSTDDLLLTNLIPTDLLPSSLVLPAPASPASSAPPSEPIPLSAYSTPLSPHSTPLSSSITLIPTLTTSALIPTPTSASADKPHTEENAEVLRSEGTTAIHTPSEKSHDADNQTQDSAHTSSDKSHNAEADRSETQDSIRTSSDKSHNAESDRSETQEIAAFSPALWVQHSMAKKRGISTIRLGDVEVDYTKTTVDELKKKLHALDILSAMPSHQHLRIWHREKLLKSNSVNLKKYHITFDSTLVVQTLDTPDPEDTTLLYLHLVNPTSPSAPLTPPAEVFVPLLQSIPMLREYVSRALNIPMEHIAMAKYAMANKIPIWKLLTFDDVETTERHELPPVLGPHSLEASRRGRHVRKRANSKHAMVKDGDIIGVIDTRTSPESIEYFRKFPPATSSHPKRHHSLLSSSPPSSRRNSAPKPRAPEAVLKINLDWD